MGKAKKLPSGNYRVREFDYTDENNVKHYKSFTAETKAQAELMAKEYKAGKIKQKKKSAPLQLKQAYEKYIALKEPVLSPSTIREYDRMRKKHLQSLMNKDIEDITQEDIQKAINCEIRYGNSPKTIRNIHGLFSAVIKHFRPDFSLNTSFPKPIKSQMKIPTNDEVKSILEYVKDTEMEIPLLICSGLGLRRSELCALTWNDINFKEQTIAINKALVQNKENEWVTKSPKSSAGYRTISIPDYIFETLKKHKKESGNITDLTPTTIYTRYKRILEVLNLPSYRLHDLRHYVASVMLALNIPNKYAMEIMGHETDDMLKKVYQHTMRDEMKKYTSKINDYFNENH